jgi:hypothetical protein
LAANTRKATIVDAVRLWRNMRDIDREEAAAVTRIPVLLTLLWGVLCTEVVALYADGELLALYGVRDMGGGQGYIWMLSTHAVALHKREVFEACTAYVDRCARRFDVLFNWVFAKNDKALRFVQRLGFEIVLEPMTVHGKPFYPIRRFSCAA